MAKTYAIELANGSRFEFTSKQCHEAFQYTRYEGSRYYLKGDEVEAADFIEAVQTGCDSWQAKKEETHKRIRVLYGSSVGCYVWKWVRK